MFRIGTKISHRLFVALMLIAVIPICITGYENYIAAQKALTGTAFAHLSTVVGDHANHLDAWFQERLHDIEILSQLPVVSEICEKHCEAGGSYDPIPQDLALLNYVVALTQGRSSSYDSVHIVTLSGTVLASTNPKSPDLINFKQLPEIERLQQSEKPELGPIHQDADQNWHMHLATKILDQHGHTVAYILAVLDISKTLDPIMTDHIGLGHTGETYLVDKNGQIITKSRFLDRSEIVKRRFDTDGIRAGLDHKKGTSIYENYIHHTVVGSYLWLPRYDWVILAEMEKKEILAPLEGIKTTVVLTAFGVSFLCLLVAFVVSRRVSQPVSRVAQAAKEFAEGHLDRRISFSSRDEIGILANSFNAMSEQISNQITSLHQKEHSLQEACCNLITTQKQLLESEKMAAIGELTASVVHEMRNPLSSIKLNLQIIGRYLSNEPPLSEHYQIAVDQVAQLERMFSDLLDYSKPFTIEDTRIDLADLIEKSLQQLVSELITKNITVKKRIDEQLPSILGDPDKIGQALVNVLKNGIEAVGTNGNIEITSSIVQPNEKTRVVITITDDGPGIPVQQLKRIFQPFFTTKQKGTGLGLPIVKKIIEAHQGEIFVSSESGKGAAVRLSFLCG